MKRRGDLLNRSLLVCSAALVLLLVASRAEADILALDPGDTTCTTDMNKNLTSAQVFTILQGCGFGPTGTLNLLYKSDVGGTDSGAFANSYDTSFLNTPTDPSDALILYLGSTYMDCSACYLVVKDGNQTPAQYFFDISSWNGIDSIQLTGFWAGNGAISNVAIWGQATQVPEPATLLLFGTAVGFVSLKRRRLA
jgi:hypothetical protein